MPTADHIREPDLGIEDLRQVWKWRAFEMVGVGASVDPSLPSSARLLSRAALATTTVYVTTEKRRQMKAIQKFRSG